MTSPGRGDARQLAREAARWLALQDAGPLDGDQARALQQWRARSDAHEALWQKAQTLRQRFAQVPAPLAVACLDRPDPERRRVMRQMLGVAVLAPIAWAGYRQLPLSSWRADLRTATGERRAVALAGGTRLQLNTASAVNLDFAEGHHRLQLVQGEISLDSPGQLWVQTRDGVLQAEAASLCVREQHQGCLVSVSRGRVSLQPLAGPRLQLQAGQRATLAPAAVTGLQAFDAQLPGWQQGLLIVDDRPLGELLRELDRYRPGVLRWDPAVERLPVTGTFQLDDTDRILALLAASLPVQVHYRTRYWVSLTPGKKIA
ncbi:FecR domain-containing protein [Pseudomonas sp. RAC1]|uniref:FecR domain-containing protein n=1 Tax=Pseudomonas sp. RAC1 TaxID=3064900 RepID=UPI002716FE05|nr:FecR domain-containing protein [Pseudomonas sp. RAC1]MDV9034426.1 FecR domain-containing protein [Pseudomonas sp. RAC1]